MQATRPLVQVQLEENGKSVTLPAVFRAPIRPDVVNFVHTSMNKNRRQPYAVNAKAGMQHSAESWGTGRAVARIPRVSGGGTNRSGQAAFGNMCRKGRMFAPTKTFRRWHRPINTTQRRYALTSALAATAVPSLVLARGHRVEQIPEIPLVVSNSVQSINKTKEAVAALQKLQAFADVEKAKASHKLRTGGGKSRNRRYVQRRGPLVVYGEDAGVVRAFRNLPGVELVNVERLNLLKLAPGGHLGRFVIWTRQAFERLDAIYGTYAKASTVKTNYNLPRPIMKNTDINRLINSSEVQTVLRAAGPARVKRAQLKKNPLRNLNAKLRLNPYAKTVVRTEIINGLKKKDSKTAKAAKAASKANLKERKRASQAQFFKVLTN